MTPAGQQIMQEIYQKHRENLAPAILAEIDKRSEQLAAASPAGHLRFLQAPVLLLHGSDDTIIPPTEMLWLKHDIPQDELVDALESPAIGHVEVGKKITLQPAARPCTLDGADDSYRTQHWRRQGNDRTCRRACGLRAVNRFGR